MQQVSLLQFGNCTLDTNRRELKLGGVAQPLTPRAFDVLAYLISHRHRVVGKEELINQVWAGAFVTDGAVVHAVSKARLAIDDPADQPRFIKTIERVGYRFIGDVTEARLAEINGPTVIGSPAAPPLSPLPSIFPLRVSLLPFFNEMKDPQYGWVDLGLKSLVQHALEHDTRLVLSPAVDVLGVMERLAPGMSHTDTAMAVQQALQAQLVLSCVVHKEVQGFRLSYRGHGPCAGGLRGELRGEELTLLAQRLADAVELAIDAKDIRPVPLAFQDPFINQTLARALEAQALQLHSRATMYFRLVMELAPDNHQVRMATLRSLAALGGEEAVRLSRQLVAELPALSDLRSRAAAHQVLGEVLEQHGEETESAHHLSEALRLMAESGQS